MSSLKAVFDQARRERRGAVVAVIPVADPDLPRSLAYAASAARGGADVLALALPFSDSLEGPELRAAFERAGKRRSGIDPFLQEVPALRERSATPLLLATYSNPLQAFGERRLLTRWREAGGSGLLVLDLPVDASGPLEATCREVDLDLVQTVGAGSGTERASRIAAHATGFVFARLRYGASGRREFLPYQARQVFAAVRDRGLSVATGPDLHRPEQAADLCRAGADGVVLGAGLAALLARAPGEDEVEAFVRAFRRALSPD